MIKGPSFFLPSLALLLLASANSSRAEELLWRQSCAVGAPNYGFNFWIEINDGLKCVKITHWPRDKSETFLTLLRYTPEKLEIFRSSISALWLPLEKENNSRSFLVSPDCRYLVEKHVEGTEGVLRDLWAGKDIAQSDNLFGGGELRFSDDGQYVVRSRSAEEDDDDDYGAPSFAGHPAGRMVTEKRIQKREMLTYATPILGGKYFVDGKSTVLNENGTEPWSMWCDVRSSSPCLWSVQGAEKITIEILGLSRNGLHFIAEENYGHDENSGNAWRTNVYLGKWGEKGVEKKVLLPNSGNIFNPRPIGLINYAARPGYYAFSDDSTKAASFHFLSTGAARLSLLNIEGKIIWSRDYDMTHEFASCKASGYDYFREMSHKMIRFSGDRIILNLIKNDDEHLQQCDVNTVLDLSGKVIYRRQDDLNVRNKEPDDPFVRFNEGNRFFLVNENKYVRYEVKPENDKAFALAFYRGKLK